MTRGVQQQVDIFKIFMQAQMFPWKRKNLETGKDEIVQVQGALRPIQLWEYVFPEESLNDVLTALEIPHENPHTGQGLSNLKIAALRKMLGNGVKPVPDYEPVKNYRYIEKRGIALYPIGIKTDKRDEKKDWGFEQEML